MATTDYIKQYEIIDTAKIVNAFNEKENTTNKKIELTDSEYDYPSTSLLTTELSKKADSIHDHDLIYINQTGDTMSSGNFNFNGTAKVYVLTPALPS
jgi:hypothetical protein